MLDQVQLVGLVCGVVGALLVTARASRIRAAGFSAWIVGDAAWVLHAIICGSIYLGVQFSVFLLLAVGGLLNNIREERLERRLEGFWR